MGTLSRVVFDPDTTAPSVPTAVAATALSNTAIRVTWAPCTDAGGSGLAGYRVFRSITSGGTYSQVSPDLSVASLAYDDTGLPGATQRFYRVQSFDGNANVSAQSSIVSATTQVDPVPQASSWFPNWPTMQVLVLQGNVALGLQDPAQHSLLADAECVVIQNFNPTLTRVANRVSNINLVRAQQDTTKIRTRFMLYTSYQQALKDFANDGGMRVNSDLINSATEGHANWWLRRVNGQQIEAPFNTATLWMINMARSGVLNSLGETYAQALWRKWSELLDPSDTAHDLVALLDGFFQDDSHFRMQMPMRINSTAPGNGTVVTDPDFEQTGVAENITLYSSAANAGSRKWCEGHLDSKTAVKARFPNRVLFYNSAECGSHYYDGDGTPPLPMSGHPMYGQIEMGLQESIGRFGMGISQNEAGTGYEFTGGGSLFTISRFLAVHQLMLCPDAQSAAGRACVVVHMNTIDRTTTTADYEYARMVFAVALLNPRCGVSISRATTRPITLNEALLELGDPIDTRTMGTLNESTAVYTQRAADFSNGVARFYWARFTKATVLLRGDSPSVGVYPSADAAVACTLPIPPAGMKHQRINENYTNPRTGRSMRVQQPTLNNGADVGTTFFLRPYHAVVLRVVPA